MSSITNFEEQLRENISLHQFSTLGIGGPARYFFQATDGESVEKAVRWSRRQNLPLFILGGGSNILISDSGFPGLVVQIAIHGIEHYEENGAMIVTASAGEDWDEFVAYVVDKDWSGIECLSGIPGKVGATPIQNVGAYGQEVKDTIISVRAYDRDQDSVVTFSNSDCEFSYRQSIFKSKTINRYIVLSVTYRLTTQGSPSVRYPELQSYLAERIDKEPTLTQVREAVITIRRKKAMVLDPDDSDSRSVGSFFVNPIIGQSEFQTLVAKFDLSEKIPNFPAPDGKVKLSAAWLIERSGLSKGYRRGNVAISSKHSLAIVNRGEGSAREVLELKEEIQRCVREKFGIDLTPEPVLVGF
jgi:UDP-N-acetylmuramate dehydrogenase